MRALLLVALMAVGCDAGRPSGKPPSGTPGTPSLQPPQPAAQPPPAAPPSMMQPAPPPAAQRAQSAAALAVATFKDENMTECSTVTVVTTPPADPAARWFTPEQGALVVLDEMKVTADGGDSVGDPAKVALFLDRDAFMKEMKETAAKEKPHKQHKSEAETDAALNKFVAKMSAQLSWPPKSMAADLKKGTIARVDSCEFPGRTVLGMCSVGASAGGASWTYVQRHYSVAATIDSDAALKRCLKLKGKWSAPSAESDEVAHERLRQHATQLQRAADPERLRRQVKQLQNMIDEPP